MLFHEVYGLYFRTIEKIISEAQSGALTKARLLELVRAHALPESALTLVPALQSGALGVLDTDLRTPLQNAPGMPLTLLEKRWLKTLLSDPRARLFDLPTEGLEDVPPLYDPQDFFCIDRYEDGDPYDDPQYIEGFRTVLRALRENRRLCIAFTSAKGNKIEGTYIPLRLEYSAKDDKFRLHCLSDLPYTINLSRVDACSLGEPFGGTPPLPARREKSIELELTDERNALERAMLHFSDLRKQTRRLGGARYRVQLWYDERDETELVIRVLSFGPMLRVIAPEDFMLLIRERLIRQRALLP